MLNTTIYLKEKLYFEYSNYEANLQQRIERKKVELI